jgi:hypothetical protein
LPTNPNPRLQTIRQTPIRLSVGRSNPLTAFIRLHAALGATQRSHIPLDSHSSTPKSQSQFAAITTRVAGETSTLRRAKKLIIAYLSTLTAFHEPGLLKRRNPTHRSQRDDPRTRPTLGVSWLLRTLGDWSRLPSHDVIFSDEPQDSTSLMESA